MGASTNIKTDRNISSNKKRQRIFGNVRKSSNILLLVTVFVITAAVLAGCSDKPENYPDAEAYVQSELEALKSADAGIAVPESINDAADQFDAAMLQGYVDKVKDFDYEILGSAAADEGSDREVAVTVRITTYDFANEYLKAWEEYMTVEDVNRWQSQFYSHLLLRLASVANKDYSSDVQIVCTEADDGKWTSALKDNEGLMDALSGGMMSEMNKLMTDDVVMDETEINQ